MYKGIVNNTITLSILTNNVTIISANINYIEYKRLNSAQNLNTLRTYVFKLPNNGYIICHGRLAVSRDPMKDNVKINKQSQITNKLNDTASDQKG